MGIVSGFVGGAGDAMATVGKMQMLANIKRETDEVNALRDGNLKTSEREASQEFTASESALDREARQKVADTKATAAAAKDGATSKVKNARDLMAQGYPKDVANAVAQGAMKQIKDEETGDMVLINALTNKPVGRLTSGGTTGDKQWIPEGGETENAPITKQHRAAAKKAAGEKAGWFSGDESDFPETGGDRKTWTKNEAQRLANEERAGTKSGIIDSATTQPAQASKTEKAPYPDGTELKGKDGKIYIVKNGKPVLKDPQ